MSFNIFLNSTGATGTASTERTALGLGTLATKNSVDLSTSDATGILADARFPALTGDITTSAGAIATTITNSAVTFAKIQNISALSLLGNPTAGSAVASQITLGTGLGFSGTTLVNTSPSSGGTVTSVSVTTANGVSGSVATATTTPAITLTLGAITPTSVAASGTVTGSNLSGTNTGNQTITLTGDVTGSGTGSFAATIANSAVTLAKMANMATASILGRNTAGTGAPEVLSASTTKTLLSLNNVENTALSTWAGSTNLTTLGTVATGTWNATAVDATHGGTAQTSWAQGNLLYASAANTLSKLAKDTNATRYLSNTGASNNPAWAQVDLSNGVTGTLSSANGGIIPTNTQVFTSSGTWTNPGVGNFVRVIMFGGGAGGGSGARRVAAAYGGGGGAGGNYLDYVIKRTGFGASETITVGAAGTGGAAVTVDNTDGNDGTDGGVSSVTVGNFSTVIYASGGVKGLGGTALAGTGGSPGVFGMFQGGAGGSAGAVAGGAAPFVYNAAPGGGSGGSWNGVSAGNGGIGTTNNILGGWYANGGGPGVAGDAGWGGGGPGTQWLGNGGTDIYFPGGGGGGGGANDGSAAAGAGGAGQLYGAAGGGGGGNNNGNNSGAGGAGAKGLVVMITY